MSDIPLEAIKKALEATNLCKVHWEYHGQATPECKPEKRRVIEIRGSDE